MVQPPIISRLFSSATNISACVCLCRFALSTLHLHPEPGYDTLAVGRKGKIDRVMVLKCVIHQHLTNPYLTQTPSAAAAPFLVFLRHTAEIFELKRVCEGIHVREEGRDGWREGGEGLGVFV